MARGERPELSFVEDPPEHQFPRLGQLQALPQQVAEEVDVHPRSRSTSANPSCSCCARRTQSTSSKRSASLLVGVSRFSSSPGRCRTTRRSCPTSESTWNPMPLILTGRMSGSLGERGGEYAGTPRLPVSPTMAG